MRILSHEQILKLHAAAVAGGLAARRPALLALIDAAFVASMPLTSTTGDQLLVDLHTMNDVDALADGTVPLEAWLANAAAIARSPKEATVFRAALDEARRRGSARPEGQPSGASRLGGVTGDAPTSDAVAPPVPTQTHGALEASSLIGAQSLFESVPSDAWLADVVSAVCRVEIAAPGRVHATGFLVGPDVVLTVAHALEAAEAMERLTFRFDHRRSGAAIGKGMVIRPAARAPLIAMGGGEIDYALVRLEASAQRRHLDLRAIAPRSLSPGLVVPYHARGEPLTLFEGAAPARWLPGARTLEYRARLGRGSIGAPVLDGAGRLVAVHAGSRGRDASYGVAVAAILADLRAKRVDAERWMEADHDDGLEKARQTAATGQSAGRSSKGQATRRGRRDPAPRRTQKRSRGEDTMAGMNGSQLQRLVDALMNAFPTEARLAQMLRFRLEKRLAEIAGHGALRDMVFELLQDAEAQGYIDDLVAAARESAPHNGKLAAFVESYGAIATAAPAAKFELMVDAARGFMEAEDFYSAVGGSLVRVCRVELSSGSKGTGFLIGPDLVMTNYHVIEAVHKGSTPPGGVILRFDYRRRAGKHQNGTEYRLAKDWLVDSSPYSTVDTSPDPKPHNPGSAELDYAILRVAGEPGKESVGRIELDKAPRGWLTPNRGVAFAANAPLFVVQHPMGEPLKVDLASYRNGHATRITYNVNTEPGSSGSPVFDAGFRLVALHHSGGPIPANVAGCYNEGIPMDAIRRLLEERKLGHLLAPASKPESAA